MASTWLLLALLCGSSAANGVFEPLRVGHPVPVYEVRTLAGATAKVGVGAPLTLVNIWATWCGPCRREFPALQQLHTQYGKRGLRVLAVSIDRGADQAVRDFVLRSRARFDIGRDENGRIQQSFKSVGVPESFLVSSDGTLLWHKAGAFDADPAGLQVAIEAALAAKQSPLPQS